MKTVSVIAAVLTALLYLASPGNLFAAEGKKMMEASSDIKSVLTAQVGNRVSVKTDSGESLEGTVTMVGDHLVHLSKLSGKDFYDAVVRIDRISSVVVRARGN